MSTTKRIINTEAAYYRERIPDTPRRIIRSNIWKTFAGPLTTIFLNAFVWRVTGSLLAVSLYNICQYIALPAAFFLNGFLLRRMRIQKVFVFGAVMAGLSAVAVVLFGGLYPNLIPIYGALWGLGNGFYWANRNYLELQETVAEWRQYFYGILYAVNSLANILVPFIAGWFIVGGQYFGLYSPEHAYWILFAVSFFMLLLCARIMEGGTFESPVPKKIVQPLFSPFLNRRRVMQMASGLFDGIEYVSVLLILYLVGTEGILGSVSALAAIAAVIALYVYGRYAKEKNLNGTFLLSGLLFLASAAVLAVTRQDFGIIFYAIFMEIGLAFSGVATSTLYCSLTEEDMGQRTETRYSYIFDNELFLNVGRILGVLVIVCLAVFYSEKVGLFYGPLVVAAIHVLFVCLFLSMKRTETGN